MRADQVFTVGNSQLQHGPVNNRVYLMHLDESDMPTIIGSMKHLAERHGYTKLFAKVPSWARRQFERGGYVVEASVPRMYADQADGVFMGCFLDADRAEPTAASKVESVLDTATDMSPRQPRALAADLSLVELGPEHAERMAEAYASVFESYPFPIHDAGFLRECLGGDVRAFAVLRGSRIAALSAAEMAIGEGNVEMTDFATLPEFRGLGLAGILLDHMEREMALAGMRTAYTISRAEAHGINIVFARAGYAHAGTLANNTQIAGSLESMNVWYKHIGED